MIPLILTVQRFVIAEGIACNHTDDQGELSVELKWVTGGFGIITEDDDDGGGGGGEGTELWVDKVILRHAPLSDKACPAGH